MVTLLGKTFKAINGHQSDVNSEPKNCEQHLFSGVAAQRLKAKNYPTAELHHCQLLLDPLLSPWNGDRTDSKKTAAQKGTCSSSTNPRWLNQKLIICRLKYGICDAFIYGRINYDAAYLKPLSVRAAAPIICPSWWPGPPVGSSRVASLLPKSGAFQHTYDKSSDRGSGISFDLFQFGHQLCYILSAASQRTASLYQFQQGGPPGPAACFAAKACGGWGFLS